MFESIKKMASRFWDGCKHVTQGRWVQFFLDMGGRALNTAWELLKLMPTFAMYAFAGVSFFCMLYMVWIGGLTMWGFWACFEASVMYAAVQTVYAMPMLWMLWTVAAVIEDLCCYMWANGDYPIEMQPVVE